MTTQFKFTAPDGKKRAANVLDYDGIIKLAKNFPGKQANRFIEWFTSSDETIDGKSKSKAYALFESSIIERIEIGTVKGLQQIHAYLNKKDYLSAMEKSVSNPGQIKALLQSTLTDRINDREMFMKGVDYSYYYEQEYELSE